MNTQWPYSGDVSGLNGNTSSRIAVVPGDGGQRVNNLRNMLGRPALDRPYRLALTLPAENLPAQGEMVKRQSRRWLAA
jgi:hypothetical protein